MEYIIVKASKDDSKEYKVLINGEENGVTGSKIILGYSGYVKVDAVECSLKEKTVNVENTTITNPMIIELYLEKP